MQKLISDHSINHTIAENINSRSIKQFHTYTGNFSFKISFSFLNQSLQGNLHKLLKTAAAYDYQNHLKTELYSLQKKTALHKTVDNCMAYCTASVWHCTDLLYVCLFNLLKTCKSILFLLCIAFSPLVIQPAQLFNCEQYLSILSYLCFSETLIYHLI
jgi:hypothetical protein